MKKHLLSVLTFLGAFFIGGMIAAVGVILYIEFFWV